MRCGGDNWTVEGGRNKIFSDQKLVLLHKLYQLAGPPSCRNIMYPCHAKTGLFMGAICVASSQKLYSLPRGFPQAVLFFSPASVVLGHVLKYGLPSPDPRVPTMNRSPHIG